MATIEDFTKWAANNGIKAPHVYIDKTDNAGYGLFGDKDLDINDTTPLVHIPRDLLITSIRALHDNQELQTAVKSIFKISSRNNNNDDGDDDKCLKEAVLESRNERLLLRLFLALQKFSNKQTSESFWKPYIDILPSLDEVRQQHVLFLIGKDEDDAYECNKVGLDGTNLSRSIYAKRSVLMRELTMIKDTVEWMTLDMWIWADIVFWSRVVSIGSSDDDGGNDSKNGDLALIPFFDFANHSLQPNIRWCPANDGGIDFVPNSSSASLAGNELLISYGDKSNQELLFLHGFTLKDNPEPSRITMALTGFLDMSMMESQVKLSWITQSSKPVLTLMVPSSMEGYRDKKVVDTSISDIITLTTGWTPESVALMYLVALDQDDGLKFELVPDISRLSISDSSQEKEENMEDENTIIQARLLDEVVEDLNDLAFKVTKLDHSAVIQLRVVMLLLDALEYHLHLITSSSSNDENVSTDTTGVMIHIERYKQDELELIQKSINGLKNLRDWLMTHESVVEFLAAQEEQEDEA
ncbi:hypothetical protein BDC45DRAFT_507534 [Circinella umbellata]|nr:hypothetical protein BDC45DRAFT_507534 [Circinella umbellata]